VYTGRTEYHDANVVYPNHGETLEEFTKRINAT
jgi:hypothetical protein